jgi:hypothetical protein
MPHALHFFSLFLKLYFDPDRQYKMAWHVQLRFFFFREIFFKKRMAKIAGGIHYTCGRYPLHLREVLVVFLHTTPRFMCDAGGVCLRQELPSRTPFSTLAAVLITFIRGAGGIPAHPSPL